MPRHRQMPGMTYQIVSQNAQQALMEYTYYCPYCMRKSTVRSVVHPSDYDRLETGGFFDSLICSECGQTADVKVEHAAFVSCANIQLTALGENGGILKENANSEKR